MKTSQETNELFAALAKAQGAMENAKKNADNPYFKSKYADLAECIDTARKPLSDNGLAVIQMPCSREGRVCLETRIGHASGQWIEGEELSTAPKDQGPQSLGTAISYLRRYAYNAATGLAAEDDDGEAAEGRGKPAAAEPKTPRRPPGSVSKKETDADRERIKAEKLAALEEAGNAAFQPGDPLPYDDRRDEPRNGASKKSEAMAFIRNMVDPKDAKRCRAAIVEHVANGHMTDGEAIECETAIIDRLRVLAFPTKEEIAEAEKDKVAF